MMEITASGSFRALAEAIRLNALTKPPGPDSSSLVERIARDRADDRLA